MNSVVSVASLASAAAVASPSISGSQIGECSYPDLAARLGDVRSKMIDQWATDKAEEAAGTDGEIDPDLERWTKLNYAMNDVVDQILDQPVKSLSDAILVIQAAALQCNEYWISDYGAGDANPLCRAVASICVFAGTDVLPGVVIPTQDDDEDVSDGMSEQPNAKLQAADPVFKTIERHREAEKHLSAVIGDLGRVQEASNFGRNNTPETRRERRNVDRRLTRAHDREGREWMAVLSAEPESELGESALVGYVRTQASKLGGLLEAEELLPFLDNVHRMVTPKWLGNLRMVPASLSA